jgi:hypothetical protein
MSLSLRAYARHRKAAGLTGGTHRAVQVAIAEGRLLRSLTADRRQIRSAALADAEWAATTNEDRIPITGPTSDAGRETAKASDLQKHRARREAALADLAELEVAEKRNDLVSVAEARAVMVDKFTVVKTLLLAVPSKLRQRDTSFTHPQLALADELIRETLTELADGAGEAARALLVDALAGASNRKGLIERGTARLRKAAKASGASATTLADAEFLLTALLTGLLNRPDEDEP